MKFEETSELPKRKSETGRHESVTVLLECGHSVVYSPPPSPEDHLFCRKCWDYRQLHSAMFQAAREEMAPAVRGDDRVHQWHVRCRSCRYSRYLGSARMTAEVRAAKHRIGRSDHVVDLYWTGIENPVLTFGGGDARLTLSAGNAPTETPEGSQTGGGLKTQEWGDEIPF